MPKKISLILLIILLLGAIHPFLLGEKGLIKKAQESMDFMAYEQAVRYLEQAVLADPDKKDIRVKQGFAYSRLGKHDEAIRVLEEEIALFPDDYKAFILLGYIYFNQGQLEEAAKVCHDFNAVLEKEVKGEALRKYSKYVLYDKKEHLEKIRTKFQKKNPNLGLPYFILGLYHQKSRNLDKASENFILALERGYDTVECHIQLINIELIKEDWQEGLARSARALRREGNQSEYYFLMGYASYHLGETENAMLSFEKALELIPYLVDAAKNLGKIYYNQDEFGKAIPHLKKTLSLAPYDFESKFLLEDSLKGKSRQKEETKPKMSKDFVDKVNLKYKYVFRTPTNRVVNSINEYALALVRSGKLDEATSFIRSFFEIHDLSPGLNYNLAQLYNMRNQLGEALKYAWRTVELKSNFKDAYDLVGNIFFKMQDFENSLQFYKKVIQIDPRDAMGHYNLGLVHSVMKDFDKAEESWKKAIGHEKLTKKGKEKKKASGDELDISLIVKARPISFDAHKSLGYLYLQRKMKDKALEEFLAAIELEPADPEPYFEIGKIHYERKDTEKATFFFDKYLYLGGKEEKVKEILKNEKI